MWKVCLQNKKMISVIIPVYKVEDFIVRCANSLMQQTMEEVEFIFVDDATPDNSIGVLKDCLQQYPERQGQIIILRHEKNQGLPAARNTGLKVATGEYIYHCDSDDFLEPEALEVMYKTAKAQDADIVWCDWFLSFVKNERYMKQPYYTTTHEALKGILNGRMKYNVWNKMVKRKLYVDNDIWFPTGYGMGEDMTMIRLFACAEKVAYVPRAFYHYVKLNGGAFTNTFSDRHLKDVLYNTELTVAFLEAKCGQDVKAAIAAFKLTVKYPFLISDNYHMYRLWRTCFPEVNHAVSSMEGQSLRSRVLQWAAFHGQFWLLWLHYKLVYKLVYGVIYK